MTRDEAAELGSQAADADWEAEVETNDPWPDDCPTIQSDVEIEAWREGYIARLKYLRKKSK